MAAHKGHAKSGGRQKGTPNKINSNLKTWLFEILDGNKDKFLQELNKLNGAEYVRNYSALLAYIIPKQQAVSIDAEKESEYKQLEKLLNDTPEQYIDEITTRIINLQKQ